MQVERATNGVNIVARLDSEGRLRLPFSRFVAFKKERWYFSFMEENLQISFQTLEIATKLVT